MNRLLPGVLAFLFVATIPLQARSFRPDQIPNGTVNSCANCHINPAGGGTRNDFGKLVEKFFLDTPGATGNVVWNPYLASLDADYDGITNGEELLDPYGEWSIGDPAPGSAANVTIPGLSSSASWKMFTLTVTDEGPHAGQTLWVRLVDKATGRETTRTSMTIPTSVPFDVNLSCLNGHSYWVEIFADGNGNDAYDGSSIDHSWIRELNNVSGNTSLSFAHTANFQELDWTYDVIFPVIGLNSYIGDWMEVRLIDEATGEEIDRVRRTTVTSDLTTFYLKGIGATGEYRIDSYVDANGNGQYDGLPDDPSWSVPISATGKDVSVGLSTTSETTDLDWRYQAVVNLLGMDADVGNAFGLRIINVSSGLQEGYVELPAIEVPDFTVRVPISTAGVAYQVDFYADASGNGSYDAPPADHAWRILFTNGYANAAITFTYNTDYTDIDWSTSSVQQRRLAPVPSSFALNQNYPNPFNPATMITFEVAEPGRVTLAVYDLLGREVTQLLDRPLTPGVYSVPFDGSGLPSGTYLYRMQTSGYSQTRRLTLVK